MIPGTDGRVHEDVTCYGCKQKGHYKTKYPIDNVQQGISALQINEEQDDDVRYDIMFTQTNDSTRGIPKSWILLDSQSTVSVFNNRVMLTDIKKTNHKLNLLTNGGMHTTDMKGELKNYGTVWYSPKSFANILSLAEVRKKFRVTMDTQVEASINIHRKNGTKTKFKEYKNELYYYDVPVINDKLNNEVTDYCFVTTVAKNKLMLTRRKIEAANKARELYALIGRPGYQRFERIVANNEMKNCPVNVSDVKRMNIIYGPDVATLEGRMVNQKPSAIPIFEPVVVPEYILQHHGKVHLAADYLMYKV